MDARIARLMEIRLLDDEAHCPEFSALAEELAEEGDPSLLPDVFRVFTDRTQHHEVMVDVQGLLETFPAGTQVDALLAALPEMLADARGWAKQLLRTLLQSDAHVAVLRQRLTAAERTLHETLGPLLDEVAGETPQTARARRSLPSWHDAR